MAKIRFELIGNDNSPITIIPGSHSQFNDYMIMHNNKRREARYCETEESIWKDEQNKDSQSTPIKIYNGILEVDEEENPTLINFLRSIPKYNTIYKEVDLSKKAEEKVNSEELIHKAKGFIFTSKEEVLSNAVKVLIPSLSTESIGIIKQGLLGLSETSPEDVIARFETKEAVSETELESQIKLAFEKKVLIVNEDNTEIQWGVNQEKIVAKKENKEAIDIALNFFKADKNKEHKDLLIQRLSDND